MVTAVFVDLVGFTGRSERLDPEDFRAFLAPYHARAKAEVMADMKEVYAEAKGMGYDTKIMRQVIRIRKMDAGDRAER